MIASAAAKTPALLTFAPDTKGRIYESIHRLSEWLEANHYCGYDPFDGLSARLLRPFTFNSALLRTVLQQGVRRLPINVRPIVGVARSRSTKGMGFLARGFLRLYDATGDRAWQDKAACALQWLVDNRSEGYTGASWGNHFDYQSRVSYVPKGVPSVVWTSLIGHAFLDAYDQLGAERYLRIAVDACQHIVHDLTAFPEGDSVCIGYFPRQNVQVHNANVLAAGLLARTYARTRMENYRILAEKAIRYTAHHQRADCSWYYGEAANLHWVDNFHTAYVLDSLKYYTAGAGDDQFAATLLRGYNHWKSTFFLADGTPRYYSFKTLPLDIQCSAQAIDTLVFFRDQDSEALQTALRVADWTITHMQDRTGYFYYRRYSRLLINRTPTLHWGQATMLCALAGLYRAL
ncbi:MAG: hypothetical protein LAQ30_05500 [Acidobacteriia bacterium]|nr:hypothetical protein [Terriglobia bacterium]